MRIFYSILIWLAIASECLAESNAGLEKVNLFQARGLKKGYCYQEVAAINCRQNCSLLLFPNMSAQLELKIEDIPQKARNEMGHFFLVEFRVLDDQAQKVALLSWRSKSLSEVQKTLRHSSGLVKGHSCNR